MTASKTDRVQVVSPGQTYVGKQSIVLLPELDALLAAR